MWWIGNGKKKKKKKKTIIIIVIIKPLSIRYQYLCVDNIIDGEPYSRNLVAFFAIILLEKIRTVFLDGVSKMSRFTCISKFLFNLNKNYLRVNGIVYVNCRNIWITVENRVHSCTTRTHIAIDFLTKYWQIKNWNDSTKKKKNPIIL